jgi:hypothetical protein
MKIENIKLFRLISKKTRQISINRSIANSLITIELNTILMKVFSFFFRLFFADKNPAIKFKVVMIKAIRMEMNWEVEKIPYKKRL